MTQASCKACPGTATGAIRPLEDSDFPQLASLHKRCFRHSTQRDDEMLQRRLRNVFMESPWHHPEINSLVWADKKGQILGFAGLLARPMQFGGVSLLSALSCQVMVDPDARGQGIGEALLRASIEGPQTFTYSDILNPAASALWHRIGGTEIPELCLQWTRPLRPFRWLAAQVGHGRGRAGILRLARPLLSTLDIVVRSNQNSIYATPIKHGYTLRPLSTKQHLALLDELPKHYDLTPRHDEQSLAWLMEVLRTGLPSTRRIDCAAVLDPHGDTIGFLLMVVEPGATATVLQLGALTASPDAVLSGVFHRADISGCAAVRGRFQSEYRNVLAKRPISLDLGGPRVMVICKRQEILESIRQGRAWISHLEGEWCIGF